MAEDGDDRSGQVIRAQLSSKEQQLVSKKLSALKDYRAAQARLTETNLDLLNAGLRPDVGVYCW